MEVELSEAEKAYAAVSATLGSLTSPRLFESTAAGAGSVVGAAGFSSSPPPAWHSPSPLDWIREQEGDEDEEDDNGIMDEDDEDNNEQDEDEVVENPLYRTPAPKATTSARQQQQRTDRGEEDVPQRAQTPVMSNESKNRHGQPKGVNTPMIPPPSSTMRPAYPPMTPALSLSATSTTTYRRYHDAWHTYCRRRRTTTTRDNLTASSQLADLELLRTLHRIGWDLNSPTTNTIRSSSSSMSTQFTRTQKEGNFWLLLAQLRPLGPQAIWWDETSQRLSEMERFVDSLLVLRDGSSTATITPRTLLQHLQLSSSTSSSSHDASSNYSMVPPLLLQRRKTILQWLESCFGMMVPPRTSWPIKSEIVYHRPHDHPPPQELLPTTNNDKELFATALSLVLAGRLSDAQALARTVGTPWRAAAWGGEAPHGYSISSSTTTTTTTPQSVGNPQRPLWRRMMWMHSEQLNQTFSHGYNVSSKQHLTNHPSCPEEGALVALFACHVKDAVANPALRTWEKGLYATLRSMWGRMEDDILHRFHEIVQQSGPGNVILPSSGYAKQEREHLQATLDIANMNEMHVIETLAASPFPEMTSHDICTEAAAAVVVGQASIMDFLNSCLDHKEVTHDEQALRFLTHAVLYLDSLYSSHPSPASTVLDELEEWKHSLVMQYLVLLGSRDDLSSLMVSYASLLPSEMLLGFFPQLLSSVDSPAERQVIVTQLHESLPNLDLILLRRVVDTIVQLSDESSLIQSESNQQVRAPRSSTPTRLDVRQMKSILWLCLNPNHKASALVFANKLLRRFLLKDNIGSAIMFLEDILPADFSNGCSAQGDGDPQMKTDPQDDDRLDATAENALSEHVAYRSYLAALQALECFRDTLETSDTRPGLVDDEVDKTRLDSTEVAIANMAERRQLIQQKRKCSNALAAAAKNAVKSLLGILRHPGGWLLTEDEVHNGKECESSRQQELEALRHKVLPNVVVSWHQVCTDTAAWMAASLEDAMIRLGSTQPSALAALDSEDNSPLAPAFWTSKALEVSHDVVSDQFGVQSSISDEEFKALLSKLADTTVQHLKYTCTRHKRS